jgi:hypothetical protein
VISFEARDLPIAEGTYLLSLWLGDWHRDYDYKPHILSLDFRPTKPPARPLKSAVVGPLNWSARWQIEMTEGPDETGESLDQHPSPSFA